MSSGEISSVLAPSIQRQRIYRAKSGSCETATERVLRTKNALRRTTANGAGGLFVTRCASSKNLRLSLDLVAGNLAGNSEELFPNSLNLL